MEKINITKGEGRDKIISVSECDNRVVLQYQYESGQKRDLEVPMDYIKYVREVIDEMVFNEKYHSKFVYNKAIRHFNIQSEILANKMEIIEKTMQDWGIVAQTRKGVLNDLRSNSNFVLMDFEEFIGHRSMKDSDYFKIYGAIKYWEHKGKIAYNLRGFIMRLN
ncbi:hypothetical protein KY320_01405 [Candidatus Woesearchaeota archaeon]|nr:hypothetical protein [Candidatus Woesearchaeota archaeon]